MQLKRTSNVERRTSNIEVKSACARLTSTFDVRRSAFDVRLCSSRRGFSFAEVMFAVVILGIGFIMVAAIFPVAIQQTQSTGEENIAALAARVAADSIIALPSTLPNPNYSPTYSTVPTNPTPYKAIATYPTFPPTVKNHLLPGTPAPGAVAPPAIVVPFDGTRWQLLQSHSIVVSDQRYAYVPFYRRENGSAAAELIVIAVAVRNKPIYTVPNDALNSGQSGPAGTGVTLGPNQYMNNVQMSPTTGQPLSAVGFTYTQIYPDTISINGGPFAEGWSAQTGTNSGLLGRTYRCGRGLGTFTIPAPGQAATYNQFEINPGDGLALTAGFDGNWGTVNAVTDPTAASCKFTSNTTLQPTVAYATLFAAPNNPTGQITLFSDASSNNSLGNAVAGAFVIVADDYPFDPANPQNQNYQLLPNYTTDYPPFMVGSMNGRIFRLGSALPPAGSPGTTFNLDPAYGMLPTPPLPPPPGTTPTNQSPDTVPSQAMIDSATANPSVGDAPSTLKAGGFRVKVYIVGAGLVNNAYSGSAQDIGCFATYFPVK